MPDESASPALVPPLQTRQNIWLPWARWSADTTGWPEFPDWQTEACLVMATGARGDGEFSVPDFDRPGESDSALANHPLVNALRILRYRGLRPSVDLGPIPLHLLPVGKPSTGPFGWPTQGSVSDTAWRDYVTGLFRALRRGGPFSAAELESWDWQLWREPDNPDSWNPASTSQIASQSNLEAYLRLLDCAQEGARRAGLSLRIRPGNLLIAAPGVLHQDSSWLDPMLAAFGRPPSGCADGKEATPRWPTGDTLIYSFSAYAGEDGQLAKEPHRLTDMARTVRASASNHLPDNPLRLEVGEGGFFRNGLLLRGDATTEGGVLLARTYQACLAAGVIRYQTWGMRSAPHISIWSNEKGLESPSSHLSRIWSSLSGKIRVSTRWLPDSRPLASRIQALAVRTGRREAAVLVIRDAPPASHPETENLRIRFTGLPRVKPVRIAGAVLARGQGDWHPIWDSAMAAEGLELPSKFDALMEHQFSDPHRLLWKKLNPQLQSAGNWPSYGDGIPKLVEGPSDWRGELEAVISLPPRSLGWVRADW